MCIYSSKIMLLHTLFFKIYMLIVVKYINNLFKILPYSWPSVISQGLTLTIFKSVAILLALTWWKKISDSFQYHYFWHILNNILNLSFTQIWILLGNIWKYARLFCQLWISLHSYKCDILSKVFNIYWVPG